MTPDTQEKRDMSVRLRHSKRFRVAAGRSAMFKVAKQFDLSQPVAAKTAASGEADISKSLENLVTSCNLIGRQLI